jgi:diguanylate cyclase (GGDEF)-like protein
MAVRRSVVRQDGARGPGRLGRWLRRWPLLAQPAPLVGYVTAVLACYLALLGWELGRTLPRPGGLLLFAALLTCGAICIEATRRLGRPAGVSRDLLSAWWLPIALLLPPVCALAAPLVLSLLAQLRVRRTAVYRRVFSAAALGLSGAAASIVFGRFGLRAGTERDLVAWFSSPGPGAWFTHPATVAVAIGCAALFSVLNVSLVAVAAHTAEPRAGWRAGFWDAESLILDVTEICVGVLVTIACVLSPLLLFVALPPVILLQRSMLRQQLRAAARTDAKTGLLNAAAWKREAEAEISGVLRSGEPLGLLLADVDHFKRVSDRHGHLAGDHVLAALAGVLSQHVRGCDVAGRFGGEEFVVLLPGADTAEALRIAERLREQAAAMPAAASGAEVTVTVSIGAAMLGVHGTDLQGLFAAADFALDRAKAGGGNRVCLPGQDRPARAAGGPPVPQAARPGGSRDIGHQRDQMGPVHKPAGLCAPGPDMTHYPGPGQVYARGVASGGSRSPKAAGPAPMRRRS